MSSQVTDTAPSEASAAQLSEHSSPLLRRLRTALSFRNISAFYILAGLLIVFSFWIPDTFWTSATLRTLLDSQAIVALAAVGLVIPLSAGVFNLAVGYQVGLAGIVAGWLLMDHDAPVLVAVVLAIASGLVVGLISGVLVVKARINSFIATLGMSSLVAATITAISGGHQILNLPTGFSDFGEGTVGPVTYSVIVMVLVSLIVWYFLERTPVGRRIYATGGNLEAARLAGVRTSTIIVGSLMAGGAIAALAGVILTSRIANADPTVGPSYLLPAFTAAFLGSTQFKGGRFNVWGTVVAVYVLAVGVKGLQLGGAPVWIPDAFNGASLLLAVGMAAYASPGKVRRRDKLKLRSRRSRATSEN